MPTVPACEFQHTRGHKLRVMRVSISLCVLGAPLITSDVARSTGIVLCALGCLLAVLLHLGFGGPAVAIDDEGLRIGRPGGGTLPWATIAAVRFLRVDQVAYLIVDRTAEARSQRKAGFFLRQPARHIGVEDIAVPLIGLRDEPRRVFEAVALAHSVANGTPPPRSAARYGTAATLGGG